MNTHQHETVAISRFFQQGRKPLGYSESYNEAELIEMVSSNLDKTTEGYRKGVLLVPIDPRQLRCAVIPMSPEMEFETAYESRVPGETPRKKTMAIVDKLPITKYATAVIYHKDVLDEDNDRSTDADWEIIVILAHAGPELEPMTPATLMANHFKADGGTATLMTAMEFEMALRESHEFWKSHTMAQERMRL